MKKQKTQLTPELATELAYGNICKGCKHYKQQDDGDAICGLTNEELASPKGSCPEFSTSDDALMRLINRTNQEMNKIEGRGRWFRDVGLVVPFLALFVGCLTGIQSWTPTALYIVIGIVVIVLIVCLWVYIRSLKKSHSKEKKVIRLLAKLDGNHKKDITLSRIVESISRLGYAPRIFEEDTIHIKYGDLNMYINYGDGLLIMQVRYDVPDEDKAKINRYRRCLFEYMSEVRLVKVVIVDDDMIIYTIESPMQYMDEFERYFESFARLLSVVNGDFFERYGQIVNPTPNRRFIYSLAYRLIPAMLDHISKKEHNFTCEALWNEEWIRQTIRDTKGYVVDAELAKFRVLSVNDYGEIKQVVYQFPEPQAAPEAKYGAVLINTRTLEYQYYTLEMSNDDLWCYGGVKDEQHLNYGEAKSADLESFLTWVLSDNKTIEAQSILSK